MRSIAVSHICISLSVPQPTFVSPTSIAVIKVACAGSESPDAHVYEFCQPLK